MPCDWQPLVELIERSQRFLLTTHARPDGDALGSQKGLAAALRQRGKHVRFVNPTGYSERYAFLDPEQEIHTFVPPGDEFRDADVLIVLDTGTWNQLAPMPDFIRSLKTEKVVIDHHPTQDDLGGRRFVDPSAEATGRLVYDLVQPLGVTMTPAIAVPIFVALATDTGWFRHSNVTATTYAIASELMGFGVKPPILYQHVYEQNSPARLRLMGKVLTRIASAGGDRITYSTIQREDYVGASLQDADDVTNSTVGLAGTEVALLFTELPKGGVKVSLRSRGAVNVGKIAEDLGGGGHRQSAGATVQAPLAEVQSRVLKAVERVLNESG